MLKGAYFNESGQINAHIGHRHWYCHFFTFTIVAYAAILIKTDPLCSACCRKLFITLKRISNCCFTWRLDSNECHWVSVGYNEKSLSHQQELSFMSAPLSLLDKFNELSMNITMYFLLSISAAPSPGQPLHPVSHFRFLRDFEMSRRRCTGTGNRLGDEWSSLGRRLGQPALRSPSWVDKTDIRYCIVG